MITEDFVSFETAKLLKEKGFDEEARSCYYFNDTSKVYSNWGIGCNYNGYGFQNICVSAPTLQIATKWLREKHKLIITIDYDEYELEESETKKVGYGWNIQKTDNPTEYLKISNRVFDTYESACEDAIKWCLTNLI